MPQPLSETERTLLHHFRDHGDPAETRRARIILLHEGGAATRDIASDVELSGSTVRFWIREWTKRRTEIFPPLPGKEEAKQIELPDDEAGEVLPDGDYVPMTSDRLDEFEDEDSDDFEAEEDVPIPGVDEPRLPLALHETIGLAPDDSMAEAGRKALHFHFERMLLHEPGSRLGEDIEAVHDMRVATRRMRSALRLFRPFFKRATIRPYRRQLRRIARALGEVRDLDVFIEKAHSFQQDNPDTNLSPLFDAWEKRLKKARRALNGQLDSKTHGQFVTQFNKFLTTPGKGALPLPAEGEAVAYQVRHIAPRLIYEHFETVRAYDTVIEGAPLATLHALRIDFKRLRYTLEFFVEALGPEAQSVIKEIKMMQDHLGDLNDAYVAGNVLQDLVDGYNEKYSGTPLFMRPDISGMLAYAAAKEAEKQYLMDTFPERWATFNRDEVRRKLALAMAVL